MNRILKLRRSGYTVAAIAEICHCPEVEVWREIDKRQKMRRDHKSRLEYLKDVPQIPGELAHAMHRGRQLTDEQEAECDRAIAIAREEIKRRAPVRTDIETARMTKRFQLIVTLRHSL